MVQRALVGALVVASVLSAHSAHCEPYVPASDAAILERLPAARATRRLEPLRRALKTHPQDVRSALQLAEGYLQIGRETSDPRFVSYAQATLAPWLQQANPPAAVLVLQATALQSSHRFDAALVYLDRALVLEPRNAQAWLTKATVLQVRGDFAQARTACGQLALTADRSIMLTCVASVDSLTGRLQRSYETLVRTASAAEHDQPQISAWITGQLAEMAMRMGAFDAAERHFKSALKSEPGDVYVRAAYADFLLMMGREREVIDLLSAWTSHDALLLRLAIAARRASNPEAMRWAEQYEARRRATRPDDNPHLREHALFVLDVLDQPRESLRLARLNWTVQHEPADVRIYLRAAHAAGSDEDMGIVHAWIRQTAYQDRTLDPFRDYRVHVAP